MEQKASYRNGLFSKEAQVEALTSELASKDTQLDVSKRQAECL